MIRHFFTQPVEENVSPTTNVSVVITVIVMAISVMTVLRKRVERVKTLSILAGIANVAIKLNLPRKSMMMRIGCFVPPVKSCQSHSG